MSLLFPLRPLEILTTALLAIAARAGEVDRAKLLELAEVPEARIQFSYNFSSQEGEKLQETHRRAEIAALVKAMAGDPSDAERWERLMELRGALGEKEEQKEAAIRAEDLYQKRLGKDPRDPRLLAGLGAALHILGSSDEAEQAFRQAAEVGPGEWRCWAGLGDVLGQKSLRALSAGTIGGFFDDKAALMRTLSLLAEPRAAPVRLTLGKKLMDEATAAMDRAIACAPPGEAEPYVRRAGFRSGNHSRYRMLLRIVEDGERDISKIYAEEDIPLRDAIANLEEAARRRPDDCHATCQAMGTILMAQKKHGSDDSFSPDQISDDMRPAVREALDRLEKQSRGADPIQSMDALEMLTMYSFICGEPGKAERGARAALARDPSRERWWNLLFALCVASERYDELGSLLREKLKTLDTAETRYLLVRLSLREEKPEEAEAELKALLEKYPDDYKGNLAMAVLILRKAEGMIARPAEAEKLRGFSASCLNRVLETKKGHFSTDEWKEHMILVAIGLALEGDAEYALTTARRIVLNFPDDEAAKKLWAALGGGDLPVRSRESDVSTEEAEKYYRAHLADFASKGLLVFRMIGIDEGAEAPAKMDAIDADLDQMSFEAAARKFYGVEGDRQGSFLWKKSLEGLKGWKQPLVKELLEMKTGEVRRRIALDGGSGWRYLELVSFTPGGPIPFEEARPGIDDAIRHARLEKAVDEALKHR